MTCDAIPVEDLVAFADGELSGDAAERVREHVTGCMDCAREIELFSRSGALLASMRRMEPTPGFADRVIGHARADAARGGGHLQRPRLHLRLRSWQAAAAALIVATGIGAAWWSRGPAEPVDPRDAATLSASEEDAIARDLYLLSNLDVLEDAEVEDLVRLVDDLDVIESMVTEEQEG